jgi:uncharacterized membrane protein (UPF0127 family)
LKIFNQTKSVFLAKKVLRADTALSRMTGLLNRKDFLDGEALVISRCNSIHMFFMRFPIDAAFIDKNKKIVGLVKRIKPFQLSPIFFNADSVVELPAGTLERAQTSVGDQLDFQS